MRGNAKPFSVELDPDIGGSPFEIKRFALIGALYLEPNRDHSSIAVKLRLFFGLFDLGYSGGVGFECLQKFRFTPKLPGRASIDIGIREYGRKLLEISMQQTVRVLVFTVRDRFEDAFIWLGLVGFFPKKRKV